MKMIAALLVAVALASPAFAQKPAFQGTHPRPKLATVAPASKPVLLHTGKPITPDQKRQLVTTVVRSSAPKGSSGTTKVMDFTQSPTIVLTPDQMSQNGAYTMAYSPTVVNTMGGLFAFSPGSGSNLVFHVIVAKNTAYTLVIKVGVGSMQNPQFTIYTGTDVNPGVVQNAPVTFNATTGDNEFAYAFTSNSVGEIPVAIYSPNSDWWFESCEITSTAF